VHATRLLMQYIALTTRAKVNIELGRKVVQMVMDGDEVNDPLFAAMLTYKSRKVSRRHWTPVAVARRAAQLLTEGEPRRILDVGSGVGKFCIVGALTTRATFVGVERREKLVKEAKALVAALDVPRVSFLCQEMSS